MSDNTDNTGTGTSNTDNAGQVNGQGTGNTNQDAEVSRLRDLETQIAKFAELERTNKSLEQQLVAAQSETARMTASYRSLQANTTSSLQEAARIRQQAAEQSKILEELSASKNELAQMREGLSFLASKMGDEDTAREFAIRQRETQARLAEEQARARIAQLQQAATIQPTTQYATQQSQSYVDLDAQKRQFVDHYFPGSGVDFNDSRIDWGYDAPNRDEAFRRFTTSVSRIISDRSAGAQPTANTQTTAESLLAQIQKEREELEKARTSAADEIREQARREVEERLRRTGADAGNAGGNTEAMTRVRTRLNEVDESKLMSGEPSARKAAAKNMEEELRSVRQQLLSQYPS